MPCGHCRGCGGRTQGPLLASSESTLRGLSVACRSLPGEGAAYRTPRWCIVQPRFQSLGRNLTGRQSEHSGQNAQFSASRGGFKRGLPELVRGVLGRNSGANVQIRCKWGVSDAGTVRAWCSRCGLPQSPVGSTLIRLAVQDVWQPPPVRIIHHVRQKLPVVLPSGLGLNCTHSAAGPVVELKPACPCTELREDRVEEAGRPCAPSAARIGQNLADLPDDAGILAEGQ